MRGRRPDAAFSASAHAFTHGEHPLFIAEVFMDDASSNGFCVNGTLAVLAFRNALESSGKSLFDTEPFPFCSDGGF